MLKTAVAVALSVAVVSSAEAGRLNVTQGEVLSSYPITKNVSERYPEQVCNTVSVPVYTRQPSTASSSDVFVGAIFGGLLGNQVGGGSGKDAATILGAIVGADMVNKKAQGGRNITSYQEETYCEVKYKYRDVQQVFGYDTSILIYNEIQVFQTNTQYQSGTFLSIGLSL